MVVCRCRKVSAFVTLGSSAACSVIEVCDASSNEARDLIVESEVGPSRWLG
jgi:hypothetical protein